MQQVKTVTSCKALLTLDIYLMLLGAPRFLCRRDDTIYPHNYFVNGAQGFFFYFYF